MNRAGWILLFILIVVCAAATFQTEHMRTASGYTLGPSTNEDSTAYADTVAAELGQTITRNTPTSTAPAPDVAVSPVCPTGSTFSRAKGSCVDSQNKITPVPCPDGYRFVRGSGKCELVAPEPQPRSARMSGGVQETPPPGVTRTQSRSGTHQEPAKCETGRTFIAGRGCVAADAVSDVTAGGTRPTCPADLIYDPDTAGNTIGTCKTYALMMSESLTTMTGFPQEPPQCPPNRPFVSGKGCVGSNGTISQPTCFDGAPYIPDPRGVEIGTCGRVPEPRRDTQDRAPPSEEPPGAYTSEGTPGMRPRTSKGLEIGGPNDGGMGRSSGGYGSASWGGRGKYPGIYGPDNQKSNLPDNNMTDKLVLPTPCQVGVDGGTLYTPGCRAPTDLGYFTLPTIPKTDGNPSPFSGDYTVFMK